MNERPEMTNGTPDFNFRLNGDTTEKIKKMKLFSSIKSMTVFS